MPMNLSALLAYSGLIAALVLLAASQNRTAPTIAVVASALQVLKALGIIHLGSRHVPLGLVLAAALAIPAFIGWFRATTKAAITAGSVATFVGAAQVLTILL